MTIGHQVSQSQDTRFEQSKKRKFKRSHKAREQISNSRNGKEYFDNRTLSQSNQKTMTIGHQVSQSQEDYGNRTLSQSESEKKCFSLKS